MQMYPVGGGNSSISVAKNSKGEYTWEEKLYFLGNDMRTIKQVIAKILKTRAILEHGFGQKVVPTEEMSKYLQSLEAQVEKTVRSSRAKQEDS